MSNKTKLKFDHIFHPDEKAFLDTLSDRLTQYEGEALTIDAPLPERFKNQFMTLMASAIDSHGNRPLTTTYHLAATAMDWASELYTEERTRFESHRVCRRLIILRELANEQENNIFPRST